MAKKKTVITTSGETPADTPEKVLEKTPEAIMKAFEDLRLKGELPLTKEGKNVGKVNDFRLAIVGTAEGEDIPAGSISMKYEADEISTEKGILQEGLDINSLYYTNSPRNEHSAVRADSLPQVDPHVKEEMDKIQSELKRFRDENDSLWGEKVKGLLPDKAPESLLKALDGKSLKDQFTMLSVLKDLKGKPNEGAENKPVVPAPQGDTRPLLTLQYGRNANKKQG